MLPRALAALFVAAVGVAAPSAVSATSSPPWLRPTTTCLPTGPMFDLWNGHATRAVVVQWDLQPRDLQGVNRIEPGGVLRFEANALRGSLRYTATLDGTQRTTTRRLAADCPPPPPSTTTTEPPATTTTASEATTVPPVTTAPEVTTTAPTTTAAATTTTVAPAGPTPSSSPPTSGPSRTTTAPPTELPHTGSGTGPLLILAAVLALIGGGALIVSRRPQEES